jgi:multicomponent Na+:H+ antiporter subunit G
MGLLLDILSLACLALGAFLALAAVLGILRLPAPFMRIHAAEALGTCLVVAGLAFRALRAELDYSVAAKLVLLAVFVAFTAPAAAHAIRHAGHTDEEQTDD